MRRLTRLVAVSEGFPSDTAPGDVWDAALLKRERRRAELQSLSLSICAGIGLNLGGGDTSRVLRPFYTDREWREFERQEREDRERVAQMQQMAKLMRLSHGR